MLVIIKTDGLVCYSYYFCEQLKIFHLKNEEFQLKIPRGSREQAELRGPGRLAVSLRPERAAQAPFRHSAVRHTALRSKAFGQRRSLHSAHGWRPLSWGMRPSPSPPQSAHWLPLMTGRLEREGMVWVFVQLDVF